MHIYKQELKLNIYAKLIRTRTLINNIKDLKKEVIYLDNKLYKLTLEKRSFSYSTQSYKDYYLSY
jgi:predicted metallo-beta-lactamase superfamily hydrolase